MSVKDGFDMVLGYYSDKYFVLAGELAAKVFGDKEVLMQVFCKKRAKLCGIRDSLKILGEYSLRDDAGVPLEIRTLDDGDEIEPLETVMTIRGPYWKFAHLETIYLGLLARQTKIATNAWRLRMAARGKEIYFFPARFDHWAVQESDGYAAFIGGVDLVSTDAQGKRFTMLGAGTMPHALIALFDGDTAKATIAFAGEYPRTPCISLVDFNNNCPATALDVAQKMRAEGLKLHGVRLDTSENMVDESLQGDMGAFRPTGVCKELVFKTRERLDLHGFGDVKIYVSGGFTFEKVRDFESCQVPVDGYGVGSSMLGNPVDFTADIVQVRRGEEWVPCAKKGREYRPNAWLV